MSCPPLESMGRYAVAVIDPPWPIDWWRDQGTAGYLDFPYDTMSMAEIAELPVREILLDDAWVFLWTTNKLLPVTFGILSGWGLTYRYTMIWSKGNGPKPVGGPTHDAEFVIVGSVGQPRYRDTKAFGMVHRMPATEHSAKPEGFYDLLRRVTHEPRIDVFNRRRIAGFQGWGHEAPMGAADPDHYQEVLL